MAEGHVKRSVQSSKDLLAKALMQIEEASKNTSAFNGVPEEFLTPGVSGAPVNLNEEEPF